MSVGCIAASSHLVEDEAVLVDVLSNLSVPLVGAIVGYAVSLTLAEDDLRTWLSGPWIMLFVVVVISAAVIGQASWLLLGDLVATLTDGHRGNLEALLSITVTAVALASVTGMLHRYDRGDRAELP